MSILKRRVCGRHSGRNGYISVPGDIIPESSGEKGEKKLIIKIILILQRRHYLEWTSFDVSVQYKSHAQT